MNKAFTLVGLLCCTLLVTGCGSKGKEDTQASTTEEKNLESESGKGESKKDEADTTNEHNVSGWVITYEQSLIEKSLENVSAVLGYGEVETENYIKDATEGKEICLVKLKFKKDGSTEVIKWDNLKLVSADGTEYKRIEDEFITDLGMKRLPGTDLNFGENQGWIAFEVDENAESLKMQYVFADETLNMDIK